MNLKLLALTLLLLVFFGLSNTYNKTSNSSEKGKFRQLDNSNLDTLTFYFHGSYNYDYYRIFINEFLFDDGLLYSMDGREKPHKSVKIIFNRTKKNSAKVKIEVHKRSEFELDYSPLWGEMNINQTIFKNPIYKEEINLEPIGNSRLFRISNNGGKLSITPGTSQDIFE